MLRTTSQTRTDALINEWVLNNKITWEDAQILNSLRAKERNEHSHSA
jgi:hypothetical protein